ncbi:MAG: 8-oxo-dGTP diphosphatase [Lentisphaeria bacterium]|nr:8-oxo-dGTP diphosphatase [Lentisphaeria bacterium]
METELCNMCMITDAEGRVLVQHRIPKPSNPWSGCTFPGGHVEPGENVVASTIREVKEETGLTVTNLQNCGYIQWYNPEKQSQYFVFLFKTSSFSGKLTGSREGKVSWMTLEEMLKEKLAPNMTRYLAVFQKMEIPQAYGISGTGKLIWIGADGMPLDGEK